MRRPVLIVTAIVAVTVACGGCASSDRMGSARSTGSGASSGGSGPGSAVDSASGSVSAVPLPSSAPSGAAASAATGSPPPRAAHAVAQVDGTTVACPAGDPPTDWTPGQSPAPLPAGVRIKAVVRCETVERTYAGLGEWQVQLAEVADSDLGPFLAALRQPSAKRPPDLICPAYRLMAPWFALVDSNLAVLHPALPTDQCGQISGTAITALNKLDFTAIDAVRTQQVASSQTLGAS